MSVNNPSPNDALDITGARAARRKLLWGAIALALVIPWFFSPWRTLFFYGIRSNNVGLVRTMLLLGTDANAPEPRGADEFHADTPLVAALRHPCRSTEIIRLLLDRKADPNHRAGRDAPCTPLSHVDPECSDAVAIVDLLVGAGAKIKACSCEAAGNSYQRSILTYQKSVELARRLIEHGADPNQVCKPGERAPVDTVKEELKALYLEHGAKFLPDTRTGKTILHGVAGAGFGVDGVDTAYRLTTAELALRHGADVNAVDAEGHTPMDYALEQNDDAMAELLAKRGGKSNKTIGDGGGETAQESYGEYSDYRTFSENMQKAGGCSLNLHGKTHSIMEEGSNLAVIKGTVAVARVRCPSSGYMHYAVLGMGPPIPKRMNMPLGSGLTSVEITFDKTWLNGVMHWYYTRGRVSNLLKAIERGEVRRIDVRHINVADANRLQGTE